MHKVCSKNTTRCSKLCFTSIWFKMVLFSKLEGYLAKKRVLDQISSKNTTRCWKLWLTSFCVKNYLLPNLKHVSLKNTFYIKSAQRIQLAVENCVSLQFVLKWSFFSKLERYVAKKCVLHEICSKHTTRCWKLCLTSFCVKKFLLPNYKHVLPKNAFCIKCAQRIQLAVENCLTWFCVENYLLPNYKHVLL